MNNKNFENRGKKIMRKTITILILGLVLIGFHKTYAQDISRKAMIDSLTTIDPEIMKFFPRWKVCETDLQIQIYKTFKLLGYPEDELDMTQIEVLATPRMDDYQPYDILMISCGQSSMNASEIEENLGILLDYLSGAESYSSGYNSGYAKRDYCYDEIPPQIPVTQNQASAIVNFLEPTNVTHSFSLSLFEQSLKIGDSGFWFKSFFGTDPIGYPFWESGEAKIILKRPLYINRDAQTSSKIPNLINVYLGAGYRITSGIDGYTGVLDFIPNRILNSAPNGKLIAGFDFNMPFHPYAGVHFNLETPINYKNDMAIERKSFGKYAVPTDENGTPMVEFTRNGIHSEDNVGAIVPVLKATGQFTLFYNWWLNNNNPENYLRFDVGMSYSEVQELAFYSINPDDHAKRKAGDYLTTQDVNGLKLYKPNEFADWLYIKAEYRNQSAYPFGISFQYSNQIFLGRVYLPLISPWLYIEAKYSTPLRDARPYEIENFFMISPILRISI